MSSVGIDAVTGKVLTGWPHVEQSIGKILTTELGSRVERRDFGSLIPRLIDQPQNEENILNFFIAAAEALEARIVRGHQYGEPRFNLTALAFDATVAGHVVLEVKGDYLPNGHRGDSTGSSPRLVIYSPNRLSDSVSLDAAAT